MTVLTSRKNSMLSRSADSINNRNILVLYIESDIEGVELASYYKEKRNIPSKNVIGVPLNWSAETSKYSGTKSILEHDDGDILLDVLKDAYLDRDIRVVLTVGTWPSTVKFSGYNNSVSNLISFAIKYANISSPDRWTSSIISNNEIEFYDKDHIRFSPTPIAGISVGISDLLIFPSKNWSKNGGRIVHFRLECSKVEDNDPRQSSRLEVLKRIIDDSITAEKSKYNDWGTVLLGGSGSYGTGFSALDQATSSYMTFLNLPCTLYHTNMKNDGYKLQRNSSTRDPGYICRANSSSGILLRVTKKGVTSDTEPTWDTSYEGAITVDGTAEFAYLLTIPSSSVPAGATSIDPGTGTFLPISDVFVRNIGLNAYHARTFTEKSGDFSYRKGAMCFFGQSYGANPSGICSEEYYYGTDRVLKDKTDPVYVLSVWKNTGRLQASTKLNVNTNLCEFKSNNTFTTADFTVLNNQITFREDGVVIGSVTVSGSYETIFNTIQANLPAGWEMRIRDPFVISRTDSAIKNGAAFASGSFEEPYTYGASKGSTFFYCVANGLNMAEAVYSSWEATTYQTHNYLIGDPLYRPFRHLNTLETRTRWQKLALIPLPPPKKGFVYVNDLGDIASTITSYGGFTYNYSMFYEGDFTNIAFSGVLSGDFTSNANIVFTVNDKTLNVSPNNDLTFNVPVDSADFINSNPQNISYRNNYKVYSQVAGIRVSETINGQYFEMFTYILVLFVINDDMYRVSINDVTVDTNATSATFSINSSRINDSISPNIPITYTTKDLEADSNIESGIAGIDYVAKTGTANIAYSTDNSSVTIDLLSNGAVPATGKRFSVELTLGSEQAYSYKFIGYCTILNP